MSFHTFPIERADALDDPSRYRYCSREELIELLAPTAGDRVLDIGSGTGFYTDDVAPFVGSLLAVDVQQAMHDRHREHGSPENVHLVTAEAGSLPFSDGTIDIAYSIVTHHEYADGPTLDEIARVISPGGRLVIVDWTADGFGDDGPSLDERFDRETIVTDLIAHGFSVDVVRERPETVAIVAHQGAETLRKDAEAVRL